MLLISTWPTFIHHLATEGDFILLPSMVMLIPETWFCSGIWLHGVFECLLLWNLQTTSQGMAGWQRVLLVASSGRSCLLSSTATTDGWYIETWRYCTVLQICEFNCSWRCRHTLLQIHDFGCIYTSSKLLHNCYILPLHWKNALGWTGALRNNIWGHLLYLLFSVWKTELYQCGCGTAL